MRARRLAFLGLGTRDWLLAWRSPPPASRARPEINTHFMRSRRCRTAGSSLRPRQGQRSVRARVTTPPCALMIKLVAEHRRPRALSLTRPSLVSRARLHSNLGIVPLAVPWAVTSQAQAGLDADDRAVGVHAPLLFPRAAVASKISRPRAGSRGLGGDVQARFARLYRPAAWPLRSWVHCWLAPPFQSQSRSGRCWPCSGFVTSSSVLCTPTAGPTRRRCPPNGDDRQVANLDGFSRPGSADAYLPANHVESVPRGQRSRGRICAVIVVPRTSGQRVCQCSLPRSVDAFRGESRCWCV